MGSHQPPRPVKYFCGILARPGHLESARETLRRELGEIDYESPVIPFEYTRYYEEEMGPDLHRCWVGFARLDSPAGLGPLKQRTNRLERELSPDPEHRSVNFDPGFLDYGKVVLASTKPHFHRIFLADGIYVEITLYYHRRDFMAFPWTYADYQANRGEFLAMRRLYRDAMRSGEGT